jgi:hypothetical protein
MLLLLHILAKAGGEKADGVQIHPSDKGIHCIFGPKGERRKLPYVINELSILCIEDHCH